MPNDETPMTGVQPASKPIGKVKIADLKATKPTEDKSSSSLPKLGLGVRG